MREKNYANNAITLTMAALIKMIKMFSPLAFEFMYRGISMGTFFGDVKVKEHQEITDFLGTNILLKVGWEKFVLECFVKQKMIFDVKMWRKE